MLPHCTECEGLISMEDYQIYILGKGELPLLCERCLKNITFASQE